MTDAEKRELIARLRDSNINMSRFSDVAQQAADALEQTLWRGIDSAPKDGTSVMLYGRTVWDGVSNPGDDDFGGEVAVVGAWSYGFPNAWATVTENPYSDLCEPTHWKPLDTPSD